MEDCAQHLGHCMVDMRELSATPEGLTAAGERAECSSYQFLLFTPHPADSSVRRLAASFLLCHLFCVRVSESVYRGEPELDRKVGGGGGDGGRAR